MNRSIVIVSLLSLSQEFIQALSDLSYGSFDDKLRWTFSLYDQDGDGVITRNELEHVVASVYSLMGTSTYPTVDQHMVKRHVDNVLQQVVHLYTAALPHFQ